MPLTPQYSWEEDIHAIRILIPLKGTNVKMMDVFVSDLLIKLNCAPYLLILDLYGEIDDTTATAQMHDGVLKISANKKECKLWGELLCSLSKRDATKRRNESIERRREYDFQMKEKKKERRHADEKYSLKKQMALEQADRQHLDDLKAEEKEKEEKAVYETIRKLQMQQAAPQKKTKSKENPLPKIVEEDKNFPEQQNNSVYELKDGVYDVSCIGEEEYKEENIMISSDDEGDMPLSDTEVEIPDEEYDEPISTKDDIVYVPAPRTAAAKKISFTPRVFPTPQRESKASEEEDWLVKNRKHLTSHKGLNSKYAKDISETDPIWLKAKADDFYRMKDYRSAINAYTEALEADDSMLACLSNRAACYLQLQENEKCVEDCTTLLSKIPDTAQDASDSSKHQQVAKQRRLKIKAMIRRGTAYCQLGHYSEAKADYGIALTMNPQSLELQHDFARISVIRDCSNMKKEGDELFSNKKYRQAIEKYSTALELDPTFISCASNRATCYLALGDAEACVKDCTECLRLLQESPQQELETNGPSKIFVSSVLPPPGTEKRRSWVVKTLVRRGTAYIQQNEMKKAEQDYADAVELDPKNQALKADLCKLQESHNNMGPP